MVANSETNGKPNGSRPVPGKQDLIEMLLSWCEMAAEAGLAVEQLYATEKKRFSVRVSDLHLIDGALVVNEDVAGVGATELPAD